LKGTFRYSHFYLLIETHDFRTREFDTLEAERIKLAKQNCVLKNPNNTLAHRMAKNAARKSARSRQNDVRAENQVKLNNIVTDLENHKAMVKTLQQEKKVLQETTGIRARNPAIGPKGKLTPQVDVEELPPRFDMADLAYAMRSAPSAVASSSSTFGLVPLDPELDPDITNGPSVHQKQWDMPSLTAPATFDYQDNIFR